MTTKKLRDTHISELFIDGDSLADALDNIDNRLEDLATDDISTISDIAEILNYIIAKFGGKSTLQQVFEVEIADIANKKNLFLCNNINPFGNNFVVEFERI